MKVKIDNLSKQSILQNISATFEPGERIALIGVNGAGKTTLLNSLMGLTPVDAGSIELADIKIGTVFQGNLLDDELTVRQNLRCRLSNSEMKGALRQISEFGIEPTMPYGQLSGGQKRIVNYFRATASQPQLLILDELTAGIDVQFQTQIWALIDTYCQENPQTILLFTTHRLEELAHANKILFLKHGTIGFYGEKQQFLAQQPNYKIVLASHQVIHYTKTAKEAVSYLEKHDLLEAAFEIKAVTYQDLFTMMERGAD